MAGEIQMSRIAIICNTGLGDGILFERLAHALSSQGHTCVVYSQFLLKVTSLYPGVNLSAYPKEIEDTSSDFWQMHDEYIFQQYAPGSNVHHPHSYVLGEGWRKESQTWSDHMRAFLDRTHPGSSSYIKSSIQPHPQWHHRRYPKRIMIHPTSLKEEKNWPESSFILLAKQLIHEGWDVEFCATAPEKNMWDPKLAKAGLSPMQALGLEALAKRIYESGYFIGNDSGVAHMAPALEIPTLKIFDRRSRAIFWSGGWPLTLEVLPWPLPTRALRTRFWKVFLPVFRVKRYFYDLVRQFP